MKLLWSRTGMFATGMLAAILVVVVLMAAGVVPVKSETTVITQQGSAATTGGWDGPTTTTVAATTRSLTPAETFYDQASPGVVEVLAGFTAAADPMYGTSGGTAQALGSGFVVGTNGAAQCARRHQQRDAGLVGQRRLQGPEGRQDRDEPKIAATIVGSDTRPATWPCSGSKILVAPSLATAGARRLRVRSRSARLPWPSATPSATTSP